MMPKYLNIFARKRELQERLKECTRTIETLQERQNSKKELSVAEQKIIKKKVSSAEKAKEKIMKDLRVFEPALFDWDLPPSRTSKHVSCHARAENVLLNVNDFAPRILIKWSAPEITSVYKDILSVPFKSSTAAGDGEARLAKIFQGVLQGPMSTFDILLPDSTMWEVKSIENDTCVRSSTLGIKLYNRALTESSFPDLISSALNFVKNNSLKNEKKTAWLKHVLENEGSKLIEGTLSRERVSLLYTALTSYVNTDSALESVICREEYKVTNAISEFLKSLAPSKVFHHVSGMFLVNSEGFIIVKKEDFDDSLDLCGASMCRPLYYFTPKE